jgi:hypothetical protein
LSTTTTVATKYTAVGYAACTSHKGLLRPWYEGTYLQAFFDEIHETHSNFSLETPS